MTEILLYDYTSIEDDGWFGQYEVFHCIGSGNLTAAAVMQQIANSNGDELLVRINSVGGSVFDGFAIYNALKSHPGKVNVRIEGLAASIASIIAMAAESIVICQAAMMMVHKPTIDPFWCGSMNADDLQREANALTQIEAVLNDIYVSRTGLGSTKVQNLIDAETWLTPDTAVTMGFADSIEKTITEKAEIVQPAFNHLFKNANQNIQAYANSAFKIKNMTNPNEAIINAVNENTKKTNSLLEWFKNSFKFGEEKDKGGAKNASATLANGNAIYYKDEDTLVEGTQVFEDADMSKPLADGNYELADESTLVVKDGAIESATEQEAVTDSAKEIADLKAQIAAKDAALASANTSLEAANSTLEKLKNVKSTYVPPAAKPEFNKPNDEPAKTSTEDAIAEAKAKRDEKKNKK